MVELFELTHAVLPFRLWNNCERRAFANPPTHSTLAGASDKELDHTDVTEALDRRQEANAPTC